MTGKVPEKITDSGEDSGSDDETQKVFKCAKDWVNFIF